MKLGDCEDLEELASLFGLTWSTLSGYIYPKIEKNYHSFEIPKKSGGSRHIRAPMKYLKSIQQELAIQLDEYYYPYKSTHGFVKDKSILTNSLHHQSKRYVFNVDLKNFFETVTFGRVRRLLMTKPIGLPKPIATVVAHICCYNGRLPQGAPTSPILTNMICKRMDRELQQLAETQNCYYTRYADDITFSFSHNISRINGGILYYEDGKIHAGPRLKTIVGSSGFSLNENKTRLQSFRQRQVVTGLVVNKQTNIKREYLKQTMAMLYAWKKHGVQAAGEAHFTNWDKNSRYLAMLKNDPSKVSMMFEKIVAGRIAFISMIRGPEDLFSRKLLHSLRELQGKPMPHLIKNKIERAAENVFVVKNPLTMLPQTGTAFFLRGHGVVTNEHVVDGVTNENAVCIDFISDHLCQTFNLEFSRASKAKDFAIFDPAPNPFEFYGLKIAPKIEILRGMTVNILGYPDYNDGDGIIHIKTTVHNSYFNIFGKTCWQVEANLIHGISGGPVLNENWEVIGIATFGSKAGAPREKINGFISIDCILDSM